MRMIAERTSKITFDWLEQTCNNWDTADPFAFAFYQQVEEGTLPLIRKPHKTHCASSEVSLAAHFVSLKAGITYFQ